MLPIKRRVIIAAISATLLLQLFGATSFAQPKSATVSATTEPAVTIFASSPSPNPRPDYINSNVNAPFLENQEVNIVAKNDIRAQDFLDWVLSHGQTPENRFGPIKSIYVLVRNATYAFAILVVIGVGFLLMIRRDKDITLMKFLPLFLVLMAYVFLSYPIVKNIYYIDERIIKGFMKIDNSQQPGCSDANFISSCNLLHISFNYADDVGGRRSGPEYDESALNSLILLKLTSWTYMAMAGVLVLRQIILWFFIIISPFLALLIPFPLLRNTAKIWIGEFFRWLLYGLLFTIFLRGLIEMWRSPGGIPMGFGPYAPATWNLVYPTSIQVLLAGPNYTVDPNQPYWTSLNNPQTYANYVIALIMLWVVIILPWLLLRVFRDMLGKWMESDSADNLMGQLGNFYSKFTPGGQPKAPAAPQPAPNAPSPTGAGQALQLPFRQVNIVARDVAVNQHQSILNNVRNESQMTQTQSNDIGKLLGMQVPRLTDIARMEMNSQALDQSWSNLQKLGNPNLAQNPQEMQHLASLRAELLRRAENGDSNAQGMLQAAQSAAAVGSDRAAIVNQSQSLAESAQRANAAIAAATASLRGSAATKVVAQAQISAKTKGRIMPVVNRTQSVSLNDYEEVKKMWVEHYKNGEVPASTKVKSKKAWIKDDIERAESAISLLGNINPQVKQKGLEMVAAILPFLLLGGFSEQETITYMKAKVEAARQVLNELEAKEAGKKEGEQTQEETLEVKNTKHATAEGHLTAEVPEDDKPAPTELPEENSVDAEAIENQLPSLRTDSADQK